MSFFKLLQKKGSNPIPPAPDSVRRETVHGAPPLRRIPQPNTSRPKSNLPSLQAGVRKVGRAQTDGTRRGHTIRRKHSSQPRLQSDSGSQGSDVELETRVKRKKLAHEDHRPQRNDLRSGTAFAEDDSGELPMVHAAHIASVDKAPKYRPAFPQAVDCSTVMLQYPSASPRETFNLVEPVQSDDFKPLDDIKETLEVVVNHYMQGSEASIFTDDSDGLLRRLKRARDKKDGPLYVLLIQEWNDAITRLRRSGVFTKMLDQLTWLDLRLIERILTQTYARTVSLRVSTLRQYENGTDNVYGELLPKFVSDIFRVTGLGPDHVFVDLGSGVGNVVLQAALEAGCESWGCEIMGNACVLAALQEQEFKARCRLWGLTNGSINLQSGDFLENATIHKALQRADVVLVNNQAFTPELNDRLTSQFLDLKEGCKIVSLKSFVPAGHKITSRNLNSPYNVLDVVEKHYYSGCVSWTDASGSYFVSTKDGSRLRKFVDKDAAGP
ncbi:MAG: hypothetical protein L6R39_002075 [Caloplaca ligustica]|nr:MAG: hypothetical protein L6R39_002075 [Caloplaca ligustica]